MPSTAFFVRHDLTHYAVETVLGLGQAFFGLLGDGWDIESFGERAPESQRTRQLPAEAIFAEILVGLLDLEAIAGAMPGEEFRMHLGQRCSGSRFPNLPSDEQLNMIRSAKASLMARWAATEPGATLDLDFPAGAIPRPAGPKR